MVHLLFKIKIITPHQQLNTHIKHVIWECMFVCVHVSHLKSFDLHHRVSNKGSYQRM